MIQRRETSVVKTGSVLMGSGNPIVIQSMTNTPTADIEATVNQVKELVLAGSELVRITVNDQAAMRAVPVIVARLKKAGVDVPIIGDFHYNGHTLLSQFPEGAKALSKYRINPGNLGKGTKKDDHFATMIKIAIKYEKPVRIGINWGSLDQELFFDMQEKNNQLAAPKDIKEVVYEAMVKSALDNAKYAEELGLGRDKIVLSVKMSEVQDMIKAYQLLAQKCGYVLHLGLTEAGGSVKGVVASSAALAVLLQAGIGDTIRISLTPEPGVGRDHEIKVCKALLQSMGLRYFMPNIVSCPGCGRTDSSLLNDVASQVRGYIEEQMPSWKKQYVGVERLNIAVMGCVVNGPGESKHADIGICIPGRMEEPIYNIYQNGALTNKLKGQLAINEFLAILDEYIKNRFS
jgi:(E)-4-hydroxy-3-methylbut-2-enyl-diphosphate synthase